MAFVLFFIKFVIYSKIFIDLLIFYLIIIDISICTPGNMFYDIGNIKTLFGENWTNIGTSITNYLPQLCTKYQSLGENVIVELSTNKNKGKWKSGDIVIIQGISSQILTADQNLG